MSMGSRKYIALVLCVFGCSVAAAQVDTSRVGNSVLDSAMVVASYPKLEGKGNVYLYTVEKSAGIISVAGEPDVVRQLACLPGVSTGIEGSLGMFIRGGNSSNCRILIDGVPVYNATHAFGLMSSLQSESIASSRIYTGGFKSSFGNYTSGIVSATQKTGAVEKFGASLTLSPYMEGVHFEVPGKVSVRFGARYSAAPLIAKYVMNNYKDKIAVLEKCSDNYQFSGNVFDVNGGVSFKMSANTVVNALGFYSKDKFLTSDNGFYVDTGWQTWMGKLGLSSVVGESKLNISFYATGYDTHTLQEVFYTDGECASRVKINAGLTELCLATNVNRTLSGNAGLEYGLDVKRLWGTCNISAFADLNTKVGHNIDFNAGLRPTCHLDAGNTRINMDVHLLSDFMIRDWLGVELALDRTNQYFHTLEGLPTSYPMNLTVPLTQKFPEETTNQIYAGLFFARNTPAIGFLGQLDINVNIGAYYKYMSNMVSYISSVNLVKNKSTSWENDADCGSGQSYGLECLLNINSERLSANVAYTLSHTDRVFPMINGGARYPFKFDRPHILNLQFDLSAAEYKTRKKNNGISHHVICNMSLSSGSRMTAVVGSYEPYPYPYYWAPVVNPRTMPHCYAIDEYYYTRPEMSAMNGVVVPMYFRLDLGYALRIESFRSSHELTLSVFNVTNRHNPYMIYNEDGVWKQLSIMPILPSIRYRMTLRS